MQDKTNSAKLKHMAKAMHLSLLKFVKNMNYDLHYARLIAKVYKLRAIYFSMRSYEVLANEFYTCKRLHVLNHRAKYENSSHGRLALRKDFS